MKINEIIDNDIIWYHGSKNKFDMFSPDYANEKEAYMQEGPGYYLTSDNKDASTYGPNILKFKVKIKKLVSTSKPPNSKSVQMLMKNSPTLKDDLENWGENPNQAFKEAFNIMMKQGSEKEVFEQIWYDFYKNNPAKWMDNLVKMGYTGVLIPKTNLLHLILYDLSALTRA